VLQRDFFMNPRPLPAMNSQSESADGAIQANARIPWISHRESPSFRIHFQGFDHPNARTYAGMQRHRALQPESPGAIPLASRRFLWKATDQCFQASPASSSGWNWYLEAAFHSPETTARLQATISRSKLPAYLFDTLPFVGPARSDSDSPTRSGSPRCARDRYRNPVA
jgi:hypothetical protein